MNTPLLHDIGRTLEKKCPEKDFYNMGISFMTKNSGEKNLILNK